MSSNFRGSAGGRRFGSAPPFIYLLPFAFIVFFAFFTPSCDRVDLPSQSGDYSILGNEIHFDGQNYVFRWVAPDGTAHLARTDKVKLVQDDRTFLQVQNREPVLHVAQDQQIQVDARDSRGNFVAPWYPFFFGSPFGGGPVVVIPQDRGGDTRTPQYRYPPTDTFGRDDSLGGSVPAPAPKPPDYTNVPNSRNTVGGQSGGTGGGAAATGKSAPTIGGQSGGTGSGGAATDKGGFRTGANAYRDGDGGSAPAPRVGGGGAGSSGGLRSPSAGSGGKSAPSVPSTGGKGIGGGRR